MPARAGGRGGVPTQGPPMAVAEVAPARGGPAQWQREGWRPAPVPQPGWSTAPKSRARQRSGAGRAAELVWRIGCAGSPRRGACREARRSGRSIRWSWAAVGPDGPASARELVAPLDWSGGLVRKGGLEPPRLAALEPKSRASTNSATFARRNLSAAVRRRRPAAAPTDNARPEPGVPSTWWAARVNGGRANRRFASRANATRPAPGRACAAGEPRVRIPRCIRITKTPGRSRASRRTGGPSRIRTLDLLIKSQLLYQLS